MEETAAERIDRELKLCERELKMLVTRYVTSSDDLLAVLHAERIGQREEPGLVHMRFARAAASFFTNHHQQPPADIHRIILWAMHSCSSKNTQVAEYVLRELFMQHPGMARSPPLLGQS